MFLAGRPKVSESELPWISFSQAPGLEFFNPLGQRSNGRDVGHELGKDVDSLNPKP